MRYLDGPASSEEEEEEEPEEDPEEDPELEEPEEESESDPEPESELSPPQNLDAWMRHDGGTGGSGGTERESERERG